MKIVVEDLDPEARVVLQGADNFQEFSVSAPPDMDSERLRSILDEVGRVDGDDHVFVRLDSLKRMAGERGADEEWLASLAGMVSFAASRGWVDEQGDVRAHIERTAP